MKQKKVSGQKIICQNRKASFNYFFIELIEAGIVLKGSEVKSLIEVNSGKTVSTVSNKLNYLIVGEKPTKRKVDYAKELSVEILNQSQWLKMLNKRS